MKIVGTTTAMGIGAPVFHAFTPETNRPEKQGVALSTMMMANKGRVIGSLRHSDGTILSCALDEDAVERFATQLAIIVEQGNDALAAHRRSNDR